MTRARELLEARLAETFRQEPPSRDAIVSVVAGWLEELAGDDAAAEEAWLLRFPESGAPLAPHWSRKGLLGLGLAVRVERP